MRHLGFFASQASEIEFPAGIDGVAIWLDADDVSTLTLETGNKVSQWSDKSGNGYHYTQSVDTKRPVYVTGAYNYLSYDSNKDDDLGLGVSLTTTLVSNHLNDLLNSGMTWVFIMENDQTPQLSYGLISRGIGTRCYNGWDGDNIWSRVTDGGSVYFNDLTDIGTKHFLSGKITPITPGINSFLQKSTFDEIEYEVSGGTIVQPSIYSNLYVGGGGNNWSLNGKIYEVLLYNRDLTDAEIISLQEYAKAKWGTTFGNDSSARLLIHSNTTHGSTIFSDSSVGGATHTVTPSGNAQHSTTQQKFKASSIYFDGTGDYLTISNHSDFNVGTGLCAIDLWIYPTNLSTSRNIMQNGFYTAGVNGNWAFTHVNNKLRFITYDGQGNQEWLEHSGILNLNDWNHIAFARSGTGANQSYLILNGVAESFTVSKALGGNSADIEIGRNDAGGNLDFIGYMDEIRFSNDKYRWDGNMNPRVDIYI